MRARCPALLVAVLATALAFASAAAADDGKLQIHLTPAGQAAARAASLTMAELGAGWAGGLEKSSAAPTPLCPPKHARESDLVLTGVAVTSFSNSQAGLLDRERRSAAPDIEDGPTRLAANGGAPGSRRMRADAVRRRCEIVGANRVRP